MNNATDELVSNEDKPLKDARLKGKAQAYFAVINLVDFLKSVEIKEKVDTSVDTRVD